MVACGDGHTFAGLLGLAKKFVDLGVGAQVIGAAVGVILMQEIATDMHIATRAELGSAVEINALLEPVTGCRNARDGTGVKTVIRFLQDDVDDASDGIRTILRRRAISQNFDVIDGGQRNHVDIDRR